MMTTGHGACWATCCDTEPRSRPVNPPRPRLATTSRSAPRAASVSTDAGDPSATNSRMGTATSSVLTCCTMPATTALASTSNSSRSTMAIDMPVSSPTYGNVHAYTACTSASRRPASTVAHRSATTEASEPSTPTTIVPDISATSLPRSDLQAGGSAAAPIEPHGPGKKSVRDGDRRGRRRHGHIGTPHIDQVGGGGDPREAGRRPHGSAPAAPAPHLIPAAGGELLEVAAPYPARRPELVISGPAVGKSHQTGDLSRLSHP